MLKKKKKEKLFFPSFSRDISDEIAVSGMESRYALSNPMHNFCEAARNSRIKWSSPYCPGGPVLPDRNQLIPWRRRWSLQRCITAPGLRSCPRGRLYCRFSRGNSCKHTAPCNTLRVRGQCWRVIANQRATAHAILTAEVGARFTLYEEQIAATLRSVVSELNENRPPGFV